MTEQLFSSVDFDSGDSQYTCNASQMFDQADKENFIPELMQSIEDQGVIPCKATPEDLKIASGKSGPICHIDPVTICLFYQSTTL